MLPIIFTLIVTLSRSQECNDDQFLYGDTCLNQCPLDTLAINQNNINQCIECDITRNLILNRERNQCVCSAGSFLTEDKYQCLPCHYSCVTCIGTQYNQCETCDVEQGSTLRIFQSGSCICPQGYFDDFKAQNPYCIKCHKDCSTCKGPNENDCIDCSDNRVKNEQGFCQCIRGFTTNSQGVCSCPSPLTIEDGICKVQGSKCGYGEQYFKMSNIEKAGKKGKPFQCKCKRGSVKIKGQCKVCGENQQYNSVKQICQCAGNSYKNEKNCIVCGNNKIFKKKIGECICKKNYFLNQKDQCVKCKPKQIYINGQCRCIPNHYRKNSSSKCMKCKRKSEHPSCFEYNSDIPFQLTYSDIIKKRKNMPIFSELLRQVDQN